MAEYIEREAAIEAVCDSKPHSCNRSDCGMECQEAKAILSIPAADVVPVRRGRWLLKQHDDEIDIYNCSCCGLGIWHYPKVLPLSTYGYCPNCGAKMDGGNNERV